MTSNINILFILLLGYSISSFVISKKTFFCFAASTPMVFGIFLAYLSPFKYFDISLICIVQVIILLTILLLFDYISAKCIKFRSNKLIYFIKKYSSFYSYLTTVFLVLGLVGFILKVLKYNLSLNPYELFQTLLSKPQLYSEMFAEGFSLIHYSGYLGILYFSLFATFSKSFHFKINLILLFIYLLSLMLLMIKVQFVIGIYILFWGIVLKSLKTKKVFVSIGSIILFLGISITLADNFLFSNDLKIAFEFLIRYLCGGLFALSQYLDSDRQLLLLELKLNFFHLYNPVFNLLGIDTIDHLPKEFYYIGNNSGTTNVGTSVQNLSLYFGLLGWIIVFSAFVLITFISFLLIEFSINLFFLFVPLFILGQVSLLITHMGSIFWKLEFIFIIVLHICIIIFYKIYLYTFK